jgi:tetratricopeptide (TPR) repeat protein
MFLRRASVAQSPQVQIHNYSEAVSGFSYVQRNASLQFPLMPDVNLRKGQTLRLLGNDAEAAKEFVDALRLKPDYTPAYAALADLYIDLNDIRAAEETIAQGLVHAPQSKILLQKKVELEMLAHSQK